MATRLAGRAVAERRFRTRATEDDVAPQASRTIVRSVLVNRLPKGVLRWKAACSWWLGER